MKDDDKRYRATMRLTITAEITEVDSGYWRNDPVGKMLDNTRERVIPTIGVFIERGGSGPKRVPAKIKLTSVTFSEDE
jgi:hypothetical protein